MGKDSFCPKCRKMERTSCSFQSLFHHMLQLFLIYGVSTLDEGKSKCNEVGLRGLGPISSALDTWLLSCFLRDILRFCLFPGQRWGIWKPWLEEQQEGKKSEVGQGLGETEWRMAGLSWMAAGT